MADAGLMALRRGVADHIRLTGNEPCLALLAAPAPAAAEQTRRWLALKERHFGDCGIEVQYTVLPADASDEGIEKAVRRAGADPRVHGVFLQHPFARALPDHVSDWIPQGKDVDGAAFDPEEWDQGMPAPATALATAALVANLAPTGTVGVVTGSAPLGPAVIRLLGKANRDVADIPSSSPDQAKRLDGLSAVVVAAGRAASVDARLIPDGAVVIDAGYDLLQGSGEVRLSPGEPARWKAFVPARGGLGPLTVAELGWATLRAAQALGPAR